MSTNRTVFDAPTAPDSFTKKELRHAMAFPQNRKNAVRTLEPWEIDLMNTMRGLEAEILDLIDAQFSTGSCNDRWLAIARTDLQKGFMALQRAIAKPSGDDPNAETPRTRLLKDVDVVHNDDGEVLAVKDIIDRDPENLKDELCLGAEVRGLGLTGDGEGTY